MQDWDDWWARPTEEPEDAAAQAASPAEPMTRRDRWTKAFEASSSSGQQREHEDGAMEEAGLTAPTLQEIATHSFADTRPT